jgi:hypothetical protein
LHAHTAAAAWDGTELEARNFDCLLAMLIGRSGAFEYTGLEEATRASARLRCEGGSLGDEAASIVRAAWCEHFGEQTRASAAAAFGESGKAWVMAAMVTDGREDDVQVVLDAMPLSILFHTLLHRIPSGFEIVRAGGQAAVIIRSGSWSAGWEAASGTFVGGALTRMRQPLGSRLCEGGMSLRASHFLGMTSAYTLNHINGPDLSPEVMDGGGDSDSGCACGEGGCEPDCPVGGVGKAYGPASDCGLAGAGLRQEWCAAFMDRKPSVVMHLLVTYGLPARDRGSAAGVAPCCALPHRSQAAHADRLPSHQLLHWRKTGRWLGSGFAPLTPYGIGSAGGSPSRRAVLLSPGDVLLGAGPHYHFGLPCAGGVRLAAFWYDQDCPLIAGGNTPTNYTWPLNRASATWSVPLGSPFCRALLEIKALWAAPPPPFAKATDAAWKQELDKPTSLDLAEAGLLIGGSLGLEVTGFDAHGDEAAALAARGCMVPAANFRPPSTYNGNIVLLGSSGCVYGVRGWARKLPPAMADCLSIRPARASVRAAMNTPGSWRAAVLAASCARTTGSEEAQQLLEHEAVSGGEASERGSFAWVLAGGAAPAAPVLAARRRPAAVGCFLSVAAAEMRALASAIWFGGSALVVRDERVSARATRARARQQARVAEAWLAEQEFRKKLLVWKRGHTRPLRPRGPPQIAVAVRKRPDPAIAAAMAVAKVVAAKKAKDTREVRRDQELSAKRAASELRTTELTGLGRRPVWKQLSTTGAIKLHLPFRADWEHAGQRVVTHYGISYATHCCPPAQPAECATHVAWDDGEITVIRKLRSWCRDGTREVEVAAPAPAAR